MRAKDVIKIDYLGLNCGICGEAFTKDDDVVVCPECGTPMHRRCYSNEKKCPNSDKHGSGYVFEFFDRIKENARADSSSDAVSTDDNDDSGAAPQEGEPLTVDSSTVAANERRGVCPMCGEYNKPGASYCNRCGSPLGGGVPPRDNTMGGMGGVDYPYADPLGGVQPDRRFEEDVTASELAVYVKVNTQYYLPAFDRIKQGKRRFNFSAAIFTHAWFLYRKQYKIGGIFLLMYALIVAASNYTYQFFSYPLLYDAYRSLNFELTSALTMEQYSMLGSYIASLPMSQILTIALPYIISALNIVLMVVAGILANKLYYNHCVSKVRSIKQGAAEECATAQDTVRLIAGKGGVNMAIAMVFALIYMYSFMFGV